MTLLAVTVVGIDRPGVVAGVTGVLADLGGNVGDSSMTILRGHVAMTLIVSVPATAADVDSALRPVTAELGLLATVGEVAEEPMHEPSGSPYVLSVHGADRPGTVSRVMAVVAAYHGNVTDLTTRLSGGQVALVAAIELPAEVDAVVLGEELRRAGEELAVDVVLRAAEADMP